MIPLLLHELINNGRIIAARSAGNLSAYVDHAILMLASLHLHMKSSEVCIKTRSPLASLPIQGQVIKHTTVKWPIDRKRSVEMVDNRKNVFVIWLEILKAFG